MKHRYEFIVGHRLMQVITLSGDHDEAAERVLLWAMRESLHFAAVTGGILEVRHHMVSAG